MRFRRLFLVGLLVPFAFVWGQTPPVDLPEGADALRAWVEAARDAALDAGVQDVLPQRLSSVDNDALSAQSKYESGDYDGAGESASAAHDRYDVLKTILDAYNLKQEADNHRFITYDSENYDAGIEAGNNALDLFDADSLEEAKTSAKDAVASFIKVLDTGWTGYAEEQSGRAQAYRQAALDAMAHIAVRELFQDADTIFNEAFVFLRAEEYRDSAGLFDNAIELFRQSRDRAVEKRVMAEEAIRQAELRVAQSGAKAKAAQKTKGE